MKSLFQGRSLAAFLLVLILPFSFVPAALAAPDGDLPVWRYTVKPGDNLINIAERYFDWAGAWPEVQKDSRIADPRHILPGTVLRIPADLLRQAPARATLENVSGVVRWRSAAAEWQPARSGLQLAGGASLETLENASVVIVFADASRIVVAPNSLIDLDTLSLYAEGLMVDTRIRLQRGQTDVHANPEQRPGQNLRMDTPSAQAVVRGTQFRLAADETSTREETLGGLVSVSGAGRAVDVPPGQGTVARQGEAPMTPVDLLAAPDVGALPSRFEQLPLRFPLPTTAAVSQWEGQIAPDVSFERILLSKSAGGQALTFADLPNGDYVLRLRAIDANGLRGFDALHRFVVFARPFPPGLNAPGNGATIRVARPPFAWGDAVDVARYQIQIADCEDFQSLLFDATLEGTQWSLPSDLPADRLYWRMASITPDGQQGPWGQPAAFTYKPGPGPTDLGQAALRIESEAIHLTLPPPANDLYYEAMLSVNKDVSKPLAQVRSDDGVLTLPRPASGSYFLGVRQVDRVDNTPGPLATQKIEIPLSRWWLMLMLLPLGI